MDAHLKRKLFFPAGKELEGFLKKHGRFIQLPVTYEALRNFESSYPLLDTLQQDSLWESPIYEPQTRTRLNHALAETYVQLKSGSDLSAIEHLMVDRIDYCAFGNSCPFRIRIINQFNDNYDYYYIKRADASRIYGLALEHILSPNAMNFIVDRSTLAEEHIAGIPGDEYIRRYTDHPGLNKVRMAKEFVKFNERCFIRLLGDMRSYNYIVDMTPDFEEIQYRVRAIDFDQQSYEGRRSFYLPQFFKDNNPIIQLCKQSLNQESMKQYQIEERTLIHRRYSSSREQMHDLMACMCGDTLSTPEKIKQLREELTTYHNNKIFRECRTMGELVLYNIGTILEEPDILTISPMN